MDSTPTTRNENDVGKFLRQGESLAKAIPLMTDAFLDFTIARIMVSLGEAGLVLMDLWRDETWRPGEEMIVAHEEMFGMLKVLAAEVDRRPLFADIADTLRAIVATECEAVQLLKTRSTA